MSSLPPFSTVSPVSGFIVPLQFKPSSFCLTNNKTVGISFNVWGFEILHKNAMNLIHSDS